LCGHGGAIDSDTIYDCIFYDTWAVITYTPPEAYIETFKPLLGEKTVRTKKIVIKRTNSTAKLGAKAAVLRRVFKAYKIFLVKNGLKAIFKKGSGKRFSTKIGEVSSSIKRAIIKKFIIKLGVKVSISRGVYGSRIIDVNLGLEPVKRRRFYWETGQTIVYFSF
jgi:hypothetical protein